MASTAVIHVIVGNAPPEVRIVRPESGTFFDWGDRIRLEVAVD
jgi:hypothetical protein